MKKHLINTNDLSMIDSLTICEQSELRGGKWEITGTVSVNYPPTTGSISVKGTL